jgi:hypothetical protein
METPPTPSPIQPPALSRQCDTPGCSDKATHVHFLPYVVSCERVELACEKHDPGGYWLPLSDFEGEQRLQHLAHVANKRDSAKAVQLFLRKLYPSW